MGGADVRPRRAERRRLRALRTRDRRPRLDIPRQCLRTPAPPPALSRQRLPSLMADADRRSHGVRGRSQIAGLAVPDLHVQILEHVNTHHRLKHDPASDANPSDPSARLARLLHVLCRSQSFRKSLAVSGLKSPIILDFQVPLKLSKREFRYLVSVDMSGKGG